MDTALSFDDALQGYLLDAQVLLTQAQECLQHLELIDNDPDACRCLDDTLESLARQLHAWACVKSPITPMLCNSYLPPPVTAAACNVKPCPR